MTTEQAIKKLADFKKQMRIAVADYMSSEGCSCCRDVKTHDKHKERIGKLLNVSKYKDGSGRNFSKYNSPK